jgi:hypothetical protein
MLSSIQSRIVADLVRKKARMLRGENLKPLRLMNTLIGAGEALVPESYLLPFSSALSRIIEETHFDETSLSPALGALLNKNRQCRTENLAKLERFATRIQEEFRSSTRDAVLAGDGAALAGLYKDAGAFPIAEWAALLHDGTYANGSNAKGMRPPVKNWSDMVVIGATTWRSPKPELLITLLAGHIGDPSASPMPPVWPHLGAALLLWKDQIGAGQIIKVGALLDQLEKVERGLAITAHIFPELADWVNVQKLSMPKWERKYAIPIAARRIMIGGRD